MFTIWQLAQLAVMLVGSILIITVLFWWVFINAGRIWEYVMDVLFPR